ncbi:virion structural protein_gp211 [Bacillus phage vB_BceM_WH1]|nr:virion structural protein_gp211 [Bacillus phage vB_BceM_WH1]
MRKVVYGSTTVDIEDNNLTVEDIREVMSETYPELANATHTERDGVIEFKVQAGTKGALRVVKYGSTTIDIEDDALTVNDIREVMSETYPELANASHTQEGNVIEFKVQAGTKGALRIVKYGSTSIDIEDDALTVNDIREVMSETYPELANASHTQEGNVIEFKVQAGTKGALRVVKYGSTSIDIEDDALTVNDIREVMSETYPELANASHTQEGNVIEFKVQAGTKGALRVVKYGSTTIDIEDDALTVNDIREVMSETYPELANASHTQEGNVIEFKVQAGTKGGLEFFKAIAPKLRKK